MMKGARDATGARARKIGGIGENRQDHVRRMKDNLTEAMARDETKEALQPFHGAERRRGLLAGEGASRLEDPRVHQPSVIHQVANGDLDVFTLGGGGGRLGIDCGGLGTSGSKTGGSVHRGSGGRPEALRTETR